MNKYKVIMSISRDYTVDILANTQEEAEELAQKEWEELNRNGIVHFFEIEDIYSHHKETFNVTNTDDPFDALNECSGVHASVEDITACKSCDETLSTF